MVSPPLPSPSLSLPPLSPPLLPFLGLRLPPLPPNPARESEETLRSGQNPADNFWRVLSNFTIKMKQLTSLRNVYYATPATSTT